jgi:hypothetical protein
MILKLPELLLREQVENSEDDSDYIAFKLHLILSHSKREPTQT